MAGSSGSLDDEPSNRDSRDTTIAELSGRDAVESSGSKYSYSFGNSDDADS